MAKIELSTKDQSQSVTDTEQGRKLLGTIRDFALPLLGIADKTDLCWHVAREVVGKLGFDDCIIHLNDADRDMLLQVAAIGPKNPVRNEILNPIEIPVGKGISGRVAQSLKPIVVDDLALDDRYIPDLNPALSEICVPLIVDGKLAGVIDCEDPRRAHFGQKHLETLTTVAEMMSAKLKIIDEVRRAEERVDELNRVNEQLKQEIAEREIVERKLRESDLRFRDFADSGSDGYWELDENLRITQITSLRKINFIAGRVEQAIGHTTWEFFGIRPDEDPKLQRLANALAAHESFHDFQFSLVSDEGEEYFFVTSGKPVLSESGKFTGYRCAISEITELVHTRNANDRFLFALDHIGEGLALWDAEERLVVCNKPLRNMVGPAGKILTPGLQYETWIEELLKHKVVPEAIGREEAWTAERLADFRNPKGLTEVMRQGRWCQNRHSKLPDGSRMQSVIDVHELKLGQQRFELATEAAGIGVWASTPDGSASNWSNSYFSLFGLTPGAVQPTRENFLSMVHADDRKTVSEIHAEAGRAGRDFTYECRIMRADDTVLWVQVRAKMVEIEGEPRWFGTLVDVDLEKRSDIAQKAFISTMNHELRTPLTAIQGSIGLILSGAFGEFSPKISNLLSIGKKNSNRLLLLINDILDIDRMESGRLALNTEPLCSDDILMDAIQDNEPFAREFQVTLKSDPKGPSFRVMADANRVQQVLSNLISNAVKFSPEGSVVELEVRKDGDFGVFLVKDQGIGISEEFRPKLFDRFSQEDNSDGRQVGGSGLGLAISKSMVEAQGGKMDYETLTGIGTTFTFTLPLAV